MFWIASVALWITRENVFAGVVVVFFLRVDTTMPRRAHFPIIIGKTKLCAPATYPRKKFSLVYWKFLFSLYSRYYLFDSRYLRLL